MADNDQKPKKGDAAPLEGVVGREIMFVLNMAFAMVGLKMLSGLAMQVAPKLGGQTLASTPGAGAAPSVAGPQAPAVPKLSTPKPSF